jgi:TolB-like protein
MTAADDAIEFGPFRLDLRRRQLSRGGKAVALGSRALDLLCALAAARGELVTKDRLMAQLWPGIAVEEHNLYVHISTLRKTLGTEENEQAYLITVPGRGYRFIGAQPAADPHPGEAYKDLPAADRPSIAVLPFQNMSGDPEQDYFADGMVEELTTALYRFKHLFVIASNSSFAYKGRSIDVKQIGHELGVRYLLEGSVRHSENRVRIAGKLIDAASGAHLWGDRFEAGLEDVFALQDRVTASVIGAIAPKLEAAEIERARRKPTDRLDAYDCYLRGAPIASATVKAANDDALRWLHKAVALDRAAKLAAIPAGESPANRGVQSLL